MRWLKAIREKFERMAMASTYAQAGEVDAAREVLSEEPRDDDRQDD